MSRRTTVLRLVGVNLYKIYKIDDYNGSPLRINGAVVVRRIVNPTLSGSSPTGAYPTFAFFFLPFSIRKIYFICINYA